MISMKPIKKYILIVVSLALCVLSCSKSNSYQTATVYLHEKSDCGYFLKVGNVYYAPVNLPDKYQNWSGVPEENTLKIKYDLLDDSLICSYYTDTTRISRMRKIKITKIKNN